MAIGIKLTIEEMQEIAVSRGGKCLSTEYVNWKTKLLWECKEAHRWWAEPAHIKFGHWCPHCAGCAKHTIEEMREIAKNRGGKCLSKEYINGPTKLLFECSERHQWWTASNNILAGHWCPKCAIERSKDTIFIMHELAKEHSGKFLSKKYINCRKKYLWSCSFGHKFRMEPSSVKEGVWCPYCLCKSEQECREIFESIFDVPFIKCCPYWFVNPETGWSLELDGYNKTLGLAFEYNGIHHYEECDWFKQDEESLKKTKKRDALKVKLCKENGVTLIVIPYWEKKRLVDFIIESITDTSFQK